MLKVIVKVFFWGTPMYSYLPKSSRLRTTNLDHLGSPSAVVNIVPVTELRLLRLLKHIFSVVLLSFGKISCNVNFCLKISKYFFSPVIVYKSQCTSNHVCSMCLTWKVIETFLTGTIIVCLSCISFSKSLSLKDRQ